VKVLIRQFLGKNHSWCVVGWGIARALKASNHDVELFSTDGVQHLPNDLKDSLIGYVEEGKPHQVHGRLPAPSYDCQISYTAMKNFPIYLSNGNKNRFGIWCFEWAGANVLPTGFAKHYKSCDYILAPSNFAKQVFIDSGVPERVVQVIPHGIDVAQYQQDSIIKLPTNKKFKILANIAQNHKRKNIPGLLTAFGKAFTIKDDVCLILKAKHKEITNQFEVSLKNCLNNFQQQFPNHAEIKIFNEFLEDISTLYRSVDAVYTMSHTEGYYFPGLEAAAAGKINIAPKWGGQLDFLNDNNALLINGKEGRADPTSLYWESKPNAKWFVPSVDDAVEKLRYAYANYQELNEQVEKQKITIHNNFNWNKIAADIIGLCQ
jgi:glycosyltransferase involved in cell wall biosynthesis